MAEETTTIIPAAPGFFLVRAYQDKDGTIFFSQPVALIAWSISMYVEKPQEPIFFVEPIGPEAAGQNCLATAIMQPPNCAVTEQAVGDYFNIEEWRTDVVKRFARLPPPPSDRHTQER